MIRVIVMLAVASYVINGLAARPSSDVKDLENMLERLLEKRDQPIERSYVKRSQEKVEEFKCQMPDVNGNNEQKVRNALKAVQGLTQQAANVFSENKENLLKKQSEDGFVEAIWKFMQQLYQMEHEAKCANDIVKNIIAKNERYPSKCRTLIQERRNYECNRTDKEDFCEIGKFNSQLTAAFKHDIECLAQETSILKKATENPDAVTEEAGHKTLIGIRTTSSDIHRMLVTLEMLYWDYHQYNLFCIQKLVTRKTEQETGNPGQPKQNGQSGQDKNVRHSKHSGPHGQGEQYSQSQNRQAKQAEEHQQEQSVISGKQDQSGKLGHPGQLNKSGQSENQGKPGKIDNSEKQGKPRKVQKSTNLSEKYEQSGKDGQPGKGGDVGQPAKYGHGRPFENNGQARPGQARNEESRSAKGESDVQLFARLKKLLSEIIETD